MHFGHVQNAGYHHTVGGSILPSKGGVANGVHNFNFNYCFLLKITLLYGSLQVSNQTPNQEKTVINLADNEQI